MLEVEPKTSNTKCTGLITERYTLQLAINANLGACSSTSIP